MTRRGRGQPPPRLTVRMVTLAEARAFIERHHRHHNPPVGHRLSLGCYAGGRLCGVAVLSRPVARMTDARAVLEVSRVCTDGTPNACSKLLSIAARFARLVGFESIQTFTLPEEGGASLRAAGWTRAPRRSPGGSWNGRVRNGRTDGQPQGPKWKWTRRLV